MAVLKVAKCDALGVGETVKFEFTQDGARREGFVIRHASGISAYRNECRHIPMTMDWVENRFLSRDGCYIQCSTHGALFEIDTGLCVAGPPEGKTLRSLDVREENGEILVTVER